MTYATEETSPQSGAPIEVYKFIGSFRNYLYTSYQIALTVDAQTYNPETITRGAVKLTTQDQSQEALEITLPFQNGMVQDYAYQEAPPSLDLELYRVHDTDYNDSILLWSGKVTSFTVQGFEAKLKVPSIFDYRLQGNVPTPRFQAPCNHIFTDARCGVSAAGVSENVTVTNVTRNVIAVSGLTYTEAQLLGGKLLSSTGESRMIVGVVGTDITVSYPFSSIGIGSTAAATRGCDHSFTTCKAQFSNGINFGGFPVVPNRNPFTSKI